MVLPDRPAPAEGTDRGREHQAEAAFATRLGYTEPVSICRGRRKAEAPRRSATQNPSGAASRRSIGGGQAAGRELLQLGREQVPYSTFYERTFRFLPDGETK